MERNCTIRITISLRNDINTSEKIYRIDTILPFIPSEGRTLFVGGQDNSVTIREVGYDLVAKKFIVLLKDRSCYMPEHATKFIRLLEDSGWTEDKEREELIRKRNAASRLGYV